MEDVKLPPRPEPDGFVTIKIIGRDVEVNAYRDSTMEAYVIEAIRLNAQPVDARVPDGHTDRLINELYEQGDPVSVDAAEELKRLQSMLSAAPQLSAHSSFGSAEMQALTLKKLVEKDQQPPAQAQSGVLADLSPELLKNAKSYIEGSGLLLPDWVYHQLHKVFLAAPPQSQPVQPSEPNPLACLHINRGSADAEADEYAAEYGAQLAQGKADADLCRGALQTVGYYVKDALRRVLATQPPAQADIPPEIAKVLSENLWELYADGLLHHHPEQDLGMAADGPPFGSKRNAAFSLYRPPFKFMHGYIYDADGKMCADEGAMPEHVVARVRGWGRIGYMPDAEALQDEVGQIIAEALSAYWSKSAQPPQQERVPLPPQHYTTPMTDERVRLIVKDELAAHNITKGE